VPERWRLAGAGLATVAALAAPAVVVDPIWQGVLVLIGVDAIVVLGLTVLFGLAGQISVAQAGLAGIGAYAVAIPATRWGWSPWWGLVLGVVIAAGVAWLIGKPVLRLEGYYLAMATLAVNIVMVVFANHLAGWTGGPYGLAGLPPLSAFGFELFLPHQMYYVVLAALAVALVTAGRLLRSPAGRQLSAIRTNPRAAGLCGVDVPRLKLKAFVLAGVFAAVGGFLRAESLLIVVPSQFGVVPSIYLIVMLVVGGMRSVWGAVVGAAFVNVVPEVMAEQPELQAIVFAVSFMVVLMFLPDGLAGGLQRIRAGLAVAAGGLVRGRTPAGG
jgi:branched-chain amino acid transport system permease protein